MSGMLPDREVEELEAVRKALDDEEKLDPKGMTHYKIFTVDESRPEGVNKTTLKKFWAKDDDEAYEVLQKYKAETQLDAPLYYTTCGYYIGSKIGPDGKVQRFDSLMEMMAAEHQSEPLYEKLWDAVSAPFWWISRKLSDIKWRIADLCYWIKHRHSRNECWALDYHMVNDLIFNIKLIMGFKHTVPNMFYEEAKSALEASGELKSINEHERHIKVMERALELFSQELERGLDLARMLMLYESYGHGEDEEFASKHRDAIPYKPGTYDDIDYAKLDALYRECWSSLWDWVKKFGHCLGD